MPDLSDSVNWSEVDANNNQAPPNGWPEGMMPSGVNDAARADKGALKRFWNKVNPVQVVTPSGGVYTFTTGNPAYPTSYVEGEIYTFSPGAISAGGDQFQVNALGPKPIWKRIASGGIWSPILANDILINADVQLVYRASLNGGLGAFVLINPFVPIANDGTGVSVVTPGSLIANQDGGAIRPTGPTAIRSIGAPNAQPAWFNDTYGGSGGIISLRHANGSNAAPAPLTSGTLIGAYGFRGWDSVGAADFSGSSARIFATTTETWNPGAHGTQLEIDTCSNGSAVLSSQIVIGPGLTVGAPTAPSGGMLIGDINAQRVFCKGQLVAGGDGSGNATISGNASIGGTLGVTGATTLGTVTAASGNITAGLTVGAGITATGEISAENLNSVGDSYVGGTLYVTGAVQAENLNSVGDTHVGNNLYVAGLINGHPAMAFDALFTQITALTNRVAELEAKLAIQG